MKILLSSLIFISSVSYAVIPTLEFCQQPGREGCPGCYDVLHRDTGLPGAVKAVNVLTLSDPLARIAHYAENDKDEYKVVSYDLRPSEVTPTSVSYTPNIELQPGQCLYMQVPAHLRNKPILFANLGHQQQHDTGWENGEDFGDKNPGLTSVQLNEANENGESRWRYWNGPSSGDFGAKFAEKNRMEQEGLYEWYHYGHSDVKTQTRSREPLRVDGMRLCAVGTDPLTIGNFSLKVHPGIAQTYVEQKFSQSNVMGDSLTAEGRSYGSRSDSLMLNSWSGNKSAPRSLPSGWSFDGRELSVPAKPGQSLTSVEVAAGDAHEDGSSGHAALHVFIQKADGTRIPVIRNENLPPEGVLIGSPVEDYTLKEGDRIVMGADGDEAFIMGVKIGYGRSEN